MNFSHRAPARRPRKGDANAGRSDGCRAGARRLQQGPETMQEPRRHAPERDDGASPVQGRAVRGFRRVFRVEVAAGSGGNGSRPGVRRTCYRGRSRETRQPGGRNRAGPKAAGRTPDKHLRPFLRTQAGCGSDVLLLPPVNARMRVHACVHAPSASPASDAESRGLGTMLVRARQSAQPVHAVNGTRREVKHLRPFLRTRAGCGSGVLLLPPVNARMRVHARPRELWKRTKMRNNREKEQTHGDTIAKAELAP